MPTFDDREKAQEAKWAHDHETTFKINARRNKLLGQWAAELMGLSEGAAEAYAKEVVKADFEETGHEDVYRKVMGDLTGKGLDISEHRVRREMAERLELARQQIMTEQASG